MSTPPGDCPSWCAVDHENGDMGRRYVHAAADAYTDLPAGPVYTRAWWSGYTDVAPDVFVTFPGAVRPEVLDRLCVVPEAAYGLALLLELLADVTPDQHKQIAAHVREAADAITKGGAS